MTNPLTATGFVARTAARTPEARTLTAGAGISITNPTGAAGDPVISTSGSSVGADIASASTTDLSTATGGYVTITGSVTITAFGTVTAGVLMTLKFTGAPLLTYNATSLIIPGAANLQIVAGSIARMRSLGSGNWQLEGFSWGTGLAVTAALTAPLGGTGFASYAVGDLLYASTTTALSKLADVATGNAVISGGVNTAPSWGKIGLATHVSGTLAETSGGTNQTTYTLGDVLYASAANTLSKLAGNTTTTTKFFAQVGNGSVSAAPTWVAYSTMVAQSAAAVAITGGDIVDTAHRRNDNVQTASYTAVLADQSQVIAGNHATVAIVITVPQYSSVNWPQGTELIAVQRGAAAVSFAAGSGVTINKPSDRTLVARAQYVYCGIRHTSTQNTWEEIGGFGT